MYRLAVVNKHIGLYNSKHVPNTQHRESVVNHKAYRSTTVHFTTYIQTKISSLSSVHEANTVSKNNTIVVSYG